MIEIKMPRLSDTMTEGAISTWRKQPGDTVAAGDTLVEIETDKAVMEYEAYQAGTLSRILVPEGQTVDIGSPIALIDDGAPAPASAPETSVPTPTPSTSERSDATAPISGGSPVADKAAAEKEAAEKTTAHTSAAGTPTAEKPGADESLPSVPGKNGARVIASPLVRKLAREHGLDLSGVTGTGPGGRIIRADIAVLAQGASAPFDPPRGDYASPRAPLRGGKPPIAPAWEGKPPAGEGTPAGAELRGTRAVPVTQVRRVIARRLSESAREIPHFYVTAAADAEELMGLRAELNSRLIAAGRAKVSVNDLLIRAVALALREHPEVNSSYAEDSLLLHDRVNIGVAVAAESGLIVPVIRDADTKTVTQIGAESKNLAALAGERKLTPEQTSGGTFTISNLGMYGVEEFTAIINPPESAILAVGGTTREPAVVGDEIVPRYKMRCTLSCDHRVIDGALAARFLKTLTALIESPWMIVA